MNVRAKAHGRAALRENNLVRKKVIGIENNPKIRGMILRSLSGTGNG
jgi:hypothetical protein